MYFHFLEESRQNTFFNHKRKKIVTFNKDLICEISKVHIIDLFNNKISKAYMYIFISYIVILWSNSMSVSVCVCFVSSFSKTMRRGSYKLKFWGTTPLGCWWFWSKHPDSKTKKNTNSTSAIWNPTFPSILKSMNVTH